MKVKTVMMAALILGLFLSTLTGSAQEQTNEKIIRAHYAAYEKKDWPAMERTLAEGFTFSSPFDNHINMEVFKEKCWPNAAKIKRFDLENIMIKGDEAFVIYNGWTIEGKLFRNTDHFKFRNGRIATYECFFGPGINYPDSKK